MKVKRIGNSWSAYKQFQVKWSLLPTYFLYFLIFSILPSCKERAPSIEEAPTLSAADILGDPSYPAISYGGYRTNTRDIQPTIEEIGEDMLLLHRLRVRMLRTYNVTLDHAKNVLHAIDSLQQINPNFEMYVMLGAWIDCKNAWTELPPIHSEESPANAAQIDTAVYYANKYPDIVKVIAVGNEAMVKWATSYYVEPQFILKWVDSLQTWKSQGKLPSNLWITSSDNFASWGGGSKDYHVPELVELIKSVDFISMHTYPMHDTHYNPDFWRAPESDKALDKEGKIQAAMARALNHAQAQYRSVQAFMDSLGVDKPIHIGETGWASSSDGHFSAEGSGACDEYKQAIYYEAIREWTERDSISCFFFEAFDEPWKDAGNPSGSENYFGLFDVNGKAKYCLWEEVDKGLFEGLSRGGKAIEKTFGGDMNQLMQSVHSPQVANEE